MRGLTGVMRTACAATTPASRSRTGTIVACRQYLRCSSAAAFCAARDPAGGGCSSASPAAAAGRNADMRVRAMARRPPASGVWPNSERAGSRRDGQAFWSKRQTTGPFAPADAPQFAAWPRVMTTWRALVGRRIEAVTTSGFDATSVPARARRRSRQPTTSRAFPRAAVLLALRTPPSSGYVVGPLQLSAALRTSVLVRPPVCRPAGALCTATALLAAAPAFAKCCSRRSTACSRRQLPD